MHSPDEHRLLTPTRRDRAVRRVSTMTLGVGMLALGCVIGLGGNFHATASRAASGASSSTTAGSTASSTAPTTSGTTGASSSVAASAPTGASSSASSPSASASSPSVTTGGS